MLARDCESEPREPVQTKAAVARRSAGPRRLVTSAVVHASGLHQTGKSRRIGRRGCFRLCPCRHRYASRACWRRRSGARCKRRRGRHQVRTSIGRRRPGRRRPLPLCRLSGCLVAGNTRAAHSAQDRQSRSSLPHSQGEGTPVGRRIGQPQLVRTSSALGVDLDFASTNPGLAGSLPFGRAGPSRGSASARGLRRRLVSVAFGLEHCRVGNTK